MWFADYWCVLPLFPLGLLPADQAHPPEQGGHLRPRPDASSGYRSSGKIIEKTIVARTMRTLGTLVASGVPILEALAIVRETCNNAVFERMFKRVFESIREGDTIAEPLKEARLVDDMVVNMIEVGEETGDLDTMLYKIADFYDEEVDTLVKGLISAARADHDRGPRASSSAPS